MLATRTLWCRIYDNWSLEWKTLRPRGIAFTRAYWVSYLINCLVWLDDYQPVYPLLGASTLHGLDGGGSGFFVSPNTNAIMSSVEPHTRGAASGILSMLNNTGQMLSIAVVFPLALSNVPFAAIQQVFIYGGGMSRFPAALAIFLGGL